MSERSSLELFSILGDGGSVAPCSTPGTGASVVVRFPVNRKVRGENSMSVLLVSNCMRTGSRWTLAGLD